MPSNAEAPSLSLRCVPKRPPVAYSALMSLRVVCCGGQWYAVHKVRRCAYDGWHLCASMCVLVWDFKCVWVWVVLWSWELTGSVRRGSLIQCFEMSPPAVVGLRDCCLGGGLEMIRCSFYLHSSRTFLSFFFPSFRPSILSFLYLSPEISTFNTYVTKVVTLCGLPPWRC